MLLRLRGGRRYLQDHERRQLLDEAAGHLRQQHDLLLRRTRATRSSGAGSTRSSSIRPTRSTSSSAPRWAFAALSHMIGVGTAESQRFEPGANPVGVYESTDGGKTFTEVWNGNSASSFGVTDVGLDPQDPTTVYASAFDQGVWRRSPSLDGTSSPTAFQQVFAPQFARCRHRPDDVRGDGQEWAYARST